MIWLRIWGDDITAVAPTRSPSPTSRRHSPRTYTGKLRPGQTVRFIGGGLVHLGAHIIAKLPKTYTTKILEDFGLEKSKP
eukprot:8121619-Alexandrium_andersonii.AAC.1